MCVLVLLFDGEVKFASLVKLSLIYMCAAVCRVLLIVMLMINLLIMVRAAVLILYVMF